MNQKPLVATIGATCLFMVLILVHFVQAQTPEDEASIRQIIMEQEDAWNKGDATAYSAHFQEDSISTIIVGAVFNGRSALEERVAQIFATIFKNSVISNQVNTIRFLRSDVALMDMTTEMTGFQALPPGVKASPDGVLRTSMLQVMVKENNEWWVAAFHNVDVKTP
jgi:uncharacterized protein (TIGR02246 family)